jgi:two-component system, cell cycle sensor histidine kinase and response regulator CckA
LELDPFVPPVMADANLLHQAVLNLCLNARDAMPGGGKIHLITQRVAGDELRQIFQDAREEQYTCITVKDSGIGMDDAVKSRIFEPFFTTKQPGEGTGLGLSVVYGIVTNHKGFIDVESDPGRGTKFRICLPIPPASTNIIQPKEQASEKGRKKHRGNGEVILFAEDEIRQLRLMQDFLQSIGYQVFAARDGSEAVETFRKSSDQIALVVLDLGLPKLNGWEAFRKMREINPSVKGIFATGFMAPQIESQLALGGVSAVIMKPYQLDEVVETISSAIKKPAPAMDGASSADFSSTPCVVKTLSESNQE